MLLPEGAKPILDARLRGYDPASDVVISFLPQPLNYYPAVYANATKRYDWRFVCDLKCHVFTDSRIAGMDKQIEDIGKMARTHVEVFYLDTGEGTTCFWMPTSDSVDAACQGKINIKALRWAIDSMPMLKCMLTDYKRFYKECLREPHQNFA